MRVGIFDIAYQMLGGLVRQGTSVRHGVFVSNTPTTVKDVEPNNLSVIYMCARILSSAISVMPIEVTKEGKALKEHELYFKLRHRLSDKYNNQAIFSTLEYQKNIFGNALFHHKRNEIIPPETITDWDFKGKGGKLRYKVNWELAAETQDKYKTKRTEEWIHSDNVWHFKGLSPDGIWGLPPVSAAMHNMKILDKATSTITNFYDNRAMSPMSLESKIDTAVGAKATIEKLEGFEAKYEGTMKAGKAIQLPPNTKLTPLQIHFADAELVATMKFTRDEICNMYGIPSFLYNSTDSVQLDIEQQSLAFRTFTILPIINIYSEEIKYKSLSKEDILNDVAISFDTTVMVETDLVSKANAYAKMIQSGLITPNEAAKKVGTDKVDSPAGDYKFVQQQLISLQEYEKMHPLLNQDGSTPPPEEEKKKESKPKKE